MNLSVNSKIKHMSFVFICLFACISSLHFDISKENSRCFVDEFFDGSVAVIKYKIWSLSESKGNLDKNIDNLRMVILDENSRLLQVEPIQSKKGKFSFMSKHDGIFRICIEKTNIYWREREPVYVKIKIMSDNMDEPILEEAIKNSDLDKVTSKFDKIFKKGQKLIKIQEKELDTEDSSAQRQMESSHYYFYIAVIQIAIVVVLGLHNAFTFKAYANKLGVDQ